jgi:drug/metabolite transporter (DMT)-like permease
MPAFRLAGLTLLAMLAFAANSVLCRQALERTTLDAASFTSLRLISGALVLWLIVYWKQGTGRMEGSWGSALALFAYAAGFSFAYISLPTGTGALLLFGTVQLTMLAAGLLHGERPGPWPLAGMLLALVGLAYLLSPSLEAPQPLGAILMIGAGIAWGLYSLRGRGERHPLQATAGNFLRSIPPAVGLGLIALPWLQWDAQGALLALASGALASGLGYAIWYAALPGLRASSAATVQLSVPLLAAAGGALILAEPITPRLLLASLAILGGIALVLLTPWRSPSSNSNGRP